MAKIAGGAVLLAAIAAVFVAAGARDPDLEAQEGAGRAYMTLQDAREGRWRHAASLAQWDHSVNITKANEAEVVKVELELSKLSKAAWEETITFPWRDYQDYQLRRMFEKYSLAGTAALTPEKHELLLKSINSMETNFATAKICDYRNATKCDLAIEPEVTEIMAKSRDTGELMHTWLEWHRVAGAKSRGNFTKYVEIKNEAAKLNGFKDSAEWWLSEYEQDNFEQQLSSLWDQIKPLYEQLHAYVRRKLRDQYGEQIVSAKGPIPVHLLGNLQAQSWGNIESFSRPYPDKPDVDVTSALLAKNYTALKMFQTADEFFRSLNLTAMPPKFWQNTVMEKPTDGREMVCHASAWDFFDGEDFRVKMCTSINGEDFQTIHHEMGHIEYYLQYKHQPIIFRAGANPGFHEAVGDVIALSVSSPKHLRRLKLSSAEADDEQTEINQLYRMGLEKLVFLPFGYLLDLYRYDIFRGITTPADYNCHYWRLREDYQGIEPPAERTEGDFDAAAKYHVSADVEYARYYVSFIIQFQFHRALCQLANEYDPADNNKKLVDCDIYQSTEAGNALGRMLQMGSSRPWPDAMEALTGQRSMSADGLLQYFQPLHDWLKQENKRTGEFIGWETSKTRYCTEEQKAAIEAREQTRRKEKLDSKNKTTET